MNSVALPASAAGSVLTAEGDLTRLAGRGDEEAFAELFRRHGQTAWRLAQAITSSRETAIEAVGQGFARALRSAGRRTNTVTVFRPTLLSAVYRSGIGSMRDGMTSSAAAAAPASKPAGRSKARAADAALAEASFRSLPERWRAAIWLSEVESMNIEQVAVVLGVSAAVASQLVVRGERGLAGRFSQARRPVPDHIGPVLRPLGAAVPANLAEETAARWRALSSVPAARLAPIGSWLSGHAERPLQIATAALLALGLVGLGIVGEGAATHTGPAAIRNTGAVGGVGVNGSGQGTFLPGSAGTGSYAVAAGSGFTSGFGTVPSSGAASGGQGSTGHSGFGTSGAGGNGSGAGGVNPGTSGYGGGSPGTGSGSPSPQTGPSPTTNPPPSTHTIVSIPGVASVGQSGGSTTVKVLPGSNGGSAASATVGCSTGVGITVGSQQIGCGSGSSSSSTTAPPSSTTSTTLPTVQKIVKDVTSSTLPGGL